MTKDEKYLIMQIAERADKKDLLMFDRLSLIMDLEAAHNEIGLKLNDLLNADEANFAHDIIGIQRNIDRRTKTIVNCFLPRFSKGAV